MEPRKVRSLYFKLIIIWLAIFVLGGFWLSVREASQPVSLSVVPEAPRENEPIMATFKLNNPTAEPMVITYQFYANGEVMKEGQTTVAPNSGKTYQYAYQNLLKLGEQVNFAVKTQSDKGAYEKVVSSPAYAPQIWSSFVSFASFSTSVMSSISTMTYYPANFATATAFNVGAVVSMLLIGLLIFLELGRTEIQERTVAVLGRLRIRFSTLTWILLIIFLGMGYTKVVCVLAMI